MTESLPGAGSLVCCGLSASVYRCLPFGQAKKADQEASTVASPFGLERNAKPSYVHGNTHQ